MPGDRVRIILVLLLTVSVAACGSIGTRSAGDRGSQERQRQAKTQKQPAMKNGEVYVVGRIELIPGLAPGEQILKTRSSRRLENKAQAYFSDEFVDIKEDGLFASRHMVDVPLNEYFVITRKNAGALYYSGANVLMDSLTNYVEQDEDEGVLDDGKLRLRAKAVYKLYPDDRAVCIGTLRYYRDPDNTITRIAHVNDCSKAQSLFRSTVSNPNIQLRAVAPAGKKRKVKTQY